MKIKDKKKHTKKQKNKSVASKPPHKQKLLIVAQELKFSRLLAGNEKKTRDRVLKTLKKWLNNCFEKGYDFKEDDFVRVWKGLFYAVWMSDKPLVQEELCDNISSILDQFTPDQYRHGVLMFKAGIKVLATEWYGLDQHRLDKFLMLVRRYLRAAFRLLQRCQWSVDSCRLFSEVLEGPDGILAPKTPIYARNAISLSLHIADCFIEELAKVAKGTIPAQSLAVLLHPFATYMSHGTWTRVCVACRRVFTQLLRHSDTVQETEMKQTCKQRAYLKLGCPPGGPDALVMEDIDDDPVDDDDEADSDGSDNDDDGETPLDPRAGRVDVILKPLPVPSKEIADMLREFLKSTTASAHTRVKVCMQRFEKLANDEYPLPLREIPTIEESDIVPDLQKKAVEITQHEDEMKNDEVREAVKALSRRQRKRIFAKARSGISIIEDLKNIMDSKQVLVTTNGGWQVEEEDPVKISEQIEEKIKKRKLTNGTTEKPQSPKKVKLVIKSPSKKSKNESKIVKNNDKSTSNDNKTKIEEKVKEKPKIYTKPDKVKLVFKTSPLKSSKDKRQNKNLMKIQSKVNEPKVKNENKSKSPALKITINGSPKSKVQPKVDLDSKGKNNVSEPSDNTTPKKVKFVLKNNSMQDPFEYFKSVRQSPNIPYDGAKKPIKTNLKPNSTPSPINPFFKKKLRLRK